MNRKSNVKTCLTFRWSSILRKCMTDMKHCQQFPANKCWGFSFSRLCYHTCKVAGEEGLNSCSHNTAYENDSIHYIHTRLNSTIILSGTHFRSNLISNGSIQFCILLFLFFFPPFKSGSLHHLSNSLSYSSFYKLSLPIIALFHQKQK